MSSESYKRGERIMELKSTQRNNGLKTQILHRDINQQAQEVE